MEKERLDYPLTPTSTVIIIGGYKGHCAESLRNTFDCNIVVFEPVREFFDILSRLKSEKIQIFNHGIAGTDRMARISIRNDSSSIIRGSDDGAYQDIALRSLAGVMAPMRQIDLLICNAEGAEFEIFQHALDEGLMPRFANVQIQWHDFVPDAVAMRSKLCAGIARTHGLTWSAGPFIWESWRRK